MNAGNGAQLSFESITSLAKRFKGSGALLAWLTLNDGRGYFHDLERQRQLAENGVIQVSASFLHPPYTDVALIFRSLCTLLYFRRATSLLDLSPLFLYNANITCVQYNPRSSFERSRKIYFFGRVVSASRPFVAGPRRDFNPRKYVSFRWYVSISVSPATIFQLPTNDTFVCRFCYLFCFYFVFV